MHQKGAQEENGHCPVTEILESDVHMKAPLRTLRNIWEEFEMKGSQGTDVVEKGTIMTLALLQVGYKLHIRLLSH